MFKTERFRSQLSSSLSSLSSALLISFCVLRFPNFKKTIIITTMTMTILVSSSLFLPSQALLLLRPSIQSISSSKSIAGGGGIRTTRIGTRIQFKNSFVTTTEQQQQQQLYKESHHLLHHRCHHDRKLIVTAAAATTTINEHLHSPTDTTSTTPISSLSTFLDGSNNHHHNDYSKEKEEEDDISNINLDFWISSFKTMKKTTEKSSLLSSSSLLLSSLQTDMNNCWSATSWTVGAANSPQINHYLGCFNSPAPQSYFALQRALKLVDQKEEQEQEVATKHNNNSNSNSNRGNNNIGMRMDQQREWIFQIFSTQLKRGYQFGILREQNTNTTIPTSNHEKGRILDWTIVSTTATATATATATTSTPRTKKSSPSDKNNNKHKNDNDNNNDHNHHHQQQKQHHHFNMKNNKNLELIKPLQDFPTTISIAHYLLELVTMASETHRIVDRNIYNQLVQMATLRLFWTLGTDIRSRASADAAFAFAMAGVTRNENNENNENDINNNDKTNLNNDNDKYDDDLLLYQLLAMISEKELRRVGPRPSYPSKYILQIIEKLAAAGIQGRQVQSVYQVAADLLELKQMQIQQQQQVQQNQQQNLGKKQQKKQKQQQQEQQQRYDDIIVLLRHGSAGFDDTSTTTTNTKSTPTTATTTTTPPIPSAATTTHDSPFFGLHSTRPLLWLWRFSARQRKAKISSSVPKNGHDDDNDNDIRTTNKNNIMNINNNIINNNNNNKFESHLKQPLVYDDSNWIHQLGDDSKDLIVDIGSGMGVSLLGLSSSSSSSSSSLLPGQLFNIPSDNKYSNENHPIPMEEEKDYSLNSYNFVGCDLNPLLVGYSSGIAKRWYPKTTNNNNNNIQFVCKPAEEFLQDIANHYKGNIKLIMIQFPTPFPLQQHVPNSTTITEATTTEATNENENENGNGNSHLPSLSNFMVSESLLQMAADLLRNNNNNDNNDNDSGGGGYLLLQSNCEDVAIYMKDLAVHNVGMTCVDAIHPVCETNNIINNNNNADMMEDVSLLPQRTREWIAMGGKRTIHDYYIVDDNTNTNDGSGSVSSCWSSAPILPRMGHTETEVACTLEKIPVHRCLLRV